MIGHQPYQVWGQPWMSTTGVPLPPGEAAEFDTTVPHWLGSAAGSHRGKRVSTSDITSRATSSVAEVTSTTGTRGT